MRFCSATLAILAAGSSSSSTTASPCPISSSSASSPATTTNTVSQYSEEAHRHGRTLKNRDRIAKAPTAHPQQRGKAKESSSRIAFNVVNKLQSLRETVECDPTKDDELTNSKWMQQKHDEENQRVQRLRRGNTGVDQKDLGILSRSSSVCGVGRRCKKVDKSSSSSLGGRCVDMEGSVLHHRNSPVLNTASTTVRGRTRNLQEDTTVVGALVVGDVGGEVVVVGGSVGYAVSNGGDSGTIPTGVPTTTFAPTVTAPPYPTSSPTVTSPPTTFLPTTFLPTTARPTFHPTQMDVAMVEAAEGEEDSARAVDDVQLLESVLVDETVSTEENDVAVTANTTTDTTTTDSIVTDTTDAVVDDVVVTTTDTTTTTDSIATDTTDAVVDDTSNNTSSTTESMNILEQLQYACDYGQLIDYDCVCDFNPETYTGTGTCNTPQVCKTETSICDVNVTDCYSTTYSVELSGIKGRWESELCHQFESPYSQRICYETTLQEYGNVVEPTCGIDIDGSSCQSCEVYKLRDGECFIFDCSNTNPSVGISPDFNFDNGGNPTSLSGTDIVQGRSGGSSNALIGNTCDFPAHTVSLYLQTYGCPSCNVCGEGFEMSQTDASLTLFNTTYDCSYVEKVSLQGFFTPNSCTYFSNVAKDSCGCVPLDGTTEAAISIVDDNSETDETDGDSVAVVVVAGEDDDNESGGETVEFADAACSAHSACAGLVGDCCPSAEGVTLGCCHLSTLADNDVTTTDGGIDDTTNATSNVVDNDTEPEEEDNDEDDWDVVDGNSTATEAPVVTSTAAPSEAPVAAIVPVTPAPSTSTAAPSESPVAAAVTTAAPSEATPAPSTASPSEAPVAAVNIVPVTPAPTVMDGNITATEDDSPPPPTGKPTSAVTTIKPTTTFIPTTTFKPTSVEEVDIDPNGWMICNICPSDANIIPDGIIVMPGSNTLMVREISCAEAEMVGTSGSIVDEELCQAVQEAASGPCCGIDIIEETTTDPPSSVEENEEEEEDEDVPDYCTPCGNSKIMSEGTDDVEVSVPTQGFFTCSELQQLGEDGTLDNNGICALVQSSARIPCGCVADGPTVAPTPEPPTPILIESNTAESGGAPTTTMIRGPTTSAASLMMVVVAVTTAAAVVGFI